MFHVLATFHTGFGGNIEPDGSKQNRKTGPRLAPTPSDWHTSHEGAHRGALVKTSTHVRRRNTWYLLIYQHLRGHLAGFAPAHDLQGSPERTPRHEGTGTQFVVSGSNDAQFVGIQSYLLKRYDWTLLAPTPVPPNLRGYDWILRVGIYISVPWNAWDWVQTRIHGVLGAKQDSVL